MKELSKIITYNSDIMGNWHHDIDLGNGKRTGQLSVPYNNKGTMQNKDYLAKFISSIYGENLKNKTVLDVACNAGGHLFSLNKYGIKYGFGFDTRQLWINQARWAAANMVYDSSNITFKKGGFDIVQDLNIYDISLFNGIFYHLANPFVELSRVADKTREVITVNTSYLPQENAPPSLVFKYESKNEEEGLSGVEGVSWLPNGSLVLINLLKALGFIEFEILFDDVSAQRLCVVASKISGLLNK